MASGYMLRVDQQQAALAAAPCEGCGHPMGQHRELGYSWQMEDGELVEVRHPDHVVGNFHCGTDGCACVVTVT